MACIPGAMASNGHMTVTAREVRLGQVWWGYKEIIATWCTIKFLNIFRIVSTFLRPLSYIHKCLLDKHFLDKLLLHKIFLHKHLLHKRLMDKLFLDKHPRHKNFLTQMSLTHIDSGHVKLDTNVSDRNFLTHVVLTVMWYSHLDNCTCTSKFLPQIISWTNLEITFSKNWISSWNGNLKTCLTKTGFLR